MNNKTKNIVIAVCLIVAVLGSYFLIKPHGFIRYVTDSSFEYIDIDGGISLTKYTGKNKDIIIPAKIDGKSVLSIKGAFMGNTDVRNIRISEGIISIDYMAFWHCISLENVDLPNSVETIGHASFDKCISLKKIKLGKNLANIMPYAFSGCLSLSYITLPEGLRFIGEKAFENCSELNEIYIPESVEIIGGVTQEENSDIAATQSAYRSQIGSTEKDSFGGCEKLEIKIAESNPYYKIQNGEIISK